MTEPLSDFEFEQAKALRRIYKQFGSLAAFFEHIEKLRETEMAEKVKQQEKELSEI